MSRNPTDTLRLIAVDLGASHGRVVLGALRRGRLSQRAVHDFSHEIREVDGRKRWDWPRITASLRQGLAAACELADCERIAGVSCSAWAQDFGLLDAEGNLVYEPVSYRDARTVGMPHRFARLVPPESLQDRVGGVVHPVATLCQLRAMVEDEPEALERADKALWIADLIHHELCGVVATDRTLATAATMRNAATGRWDRELLERLDIPTRLLPPIVDEPMVIGHVKADRAPHPALAGVPVIAGAGHDTAAAGAALAPLREGTLMLSLGTWAMLGACLDAFRPPRDPAISVMGMAFGKWAYFHGGMGLWLLHECARTWRERGESPDLRELVRAAERSRVRSVVPANDPRFFAPDDMPAEIAAACAETGQEVPANPGDFARVIFESLAQAFAESVDRLGEASGLTFDRLNVLGGGSRNRFLCQRIAKATGLPVACGPAEATAVGALLLQAVALDELDVDAVPDVVRASFDSVTYEPA